MKSKYTWDLEYTLWPASDCAKASLRVFSRCIWFNSHYTREKDVTFVFYSCCSVAKSCLSLRSHGLQHASLPCPSLSPGVCSNSCPLYFVGSFSVINQQIFAKKL